MSTCQHVSWLFVVFAFGVGVTVGVCVLVGVGMCVGMCVEVDVGVGVEFDADVGVDVLVDVDVGLSCDDTWHPETPKPDFVFPLSHDRHPA